MPQKKNPDAAELLRAKAPRDRRRTSPRCTACMHGLPLTYNKDMQEDKEHLFDTADTLALSLAAARGMLESVAFQRERLAAAAADEMIAAVDIADLLVRGGRAVPRGARQSSPGSCGPRSQEGRTLSSCSDDELAGARAGARPGGAARAAARPGRGSSRRCPRAAPRSARVREQLAAGARRARGSG